MDEGWEEPLDWRFILRVMNIIRDDCVLIYDTTDSPTVFVIWNTRYLRVEYLYAEYLAKAKKGQTAGQNTDLAAVVRARGLPGDHCGHIVAAQHGGRMVFYNLFPQDPFFNIGSKDEKPQPYWKSIDASICGAIKSGKDMTIEVQYSFTYDNAVSTTRPTEIHVLGRETVGTCVNVHENVVPNFKGKGQKLRGRDVSTKEKHKQKFNWQSGQCKDESLKKFIRYDDSDNLAGEFNSNGEKKQNK